MKTYAELVRCEPADNLLSETRPPVRQPLFRLGSCSEKNQNSMKQLLETVGRY